MADFHDIITAQSDMSYDDQKRAGQPMQGEMPALHTEFLAQVISLIDRKEMDANDPKSLINAEFYGKMPEAVQGRVDLMLPNVADLLRHIEWFFRNPATPNACPQLKTMIEQLWEMVGRLGPQRIVFKFTIPNTPNGQ